MLAVRFPPAALCGAARGVRQMRIIECTTIGPYTVLVFDGPLPFTEWRAIVVDGGRYDTLPVMDAGDDCLAIIEAQI